MRDGTESADTATRAGLATANCHMTGPATLPEVSATVTATVCTPGPRFPGAQTKRPDAKLPQDVTSEPSTVTRSVSSSTPVPSSLTANPIGVAPTTVDPGSGLRWAIRGGVSSRTWNDQVSGGDTLPDRSLGRGGTLWVAVAPGAGGAGGEGGPPPG